MVVPDDRPTYETELSTYWFEPDGLLISLSKPPKRTLTNTNENFELVARITNQTKVPMLVYICNSPVPDKATRQFVARKLPDVYKAMAMVSGGALGKLIMNMIFSINPPSIPMRSFSDEEKAREWLRTFL
ncbi:MAG: STAS/SEC14 domain-containing protein [Flavobacteriales bacterium]|nr:STAS/SEC14 domain-containing protein [Flavobacteriales bacterium]